MRRGYKFYSSIFLIVLIISSFAFHHTAKAPPFKSTFIKHVIGDSKETILPSGLVVADLDGDGDLDIVSVAGRQDNESVIWFENDGQHHPSFTNHVILRYADCPSTISSFGVSYPIYFSGGDFDEDGDIDLLANHLAWNADAMIWLENNGKRPPKFITHILKTGDKEGTKDYDHLIEINTHTRIKQGIEDKISDSYGFSIGNYKADINKDGIQDTIVITDHDLIWSDCNPNVKTFYNHVIRHRDERYAFVRSTHAADLNGDGNIDPILVSVDENAILWFENNGKEKPDFTMRPIYQNSRIPYRLFNLGQSFPFQPYEVDTGDFDQDGDIDVVAVNHEGYDPGHLILFENDGKHPPSFVPHIFQENESFFHIKCADIDHDGDLDIAYISYAQNRIGWYENTLIP